MEKIRKNSGRQKYPKIQGFADRLKDVRKRSGLKGEEIAARFGQEMLEGQAIDQTTISWWETGKGEPPLAYLVFLAKNFGVDLGWLVLGREPAEAAKEDMPANKEIAQELRALRQEIKELRAEAAQAVPTALDLETATSMSAKAESTEAGKE